MKKIIIGIVIVIIAALFIFNFTTKLLNPRINNFFNSIVAGEIDQSCEVDEDCKIDKDSCTCGCPIAVNINWSSFCPLKNPKNMSCDLCMIHTKARCDEGKCVPTNDNIFFHG